MLVNRDKEKYEKLISAQKEYTKHRKDDATIEELVPFAENFIKSLSELKDFLPKKKTVTLKTADYNMISMTIQDITSSGVLTKIDSKLFFEFFAFVTSFGSDNVPRDICALFQNAIFELLNVIIQIKPRGFRPFAILKLQNPQELFGKDFYMHLLFLPREKYDYMMEYFSNSFYDPLSKGCCNTWFTWFIASIKEISKKQFNDNLIFNIIYLYISFVSEPLQQIKEPLGQLRSFWGHKMSDEVRNKLIRKFEESIERTQNNLLINSFLLFLLDNNLFTGSNFNHILSNGHAKNFIVYIACCSFFEITKINSGKLTEYANSHSRSKTLPEKTIGFLQNVQDLYQKPWKYSQKNIQLDMFGYSPDSHMENAGFDNDVITLTKEQVSRICNDKIPDACSLFIHTIFYLADLCPQVAQAYPRKKLCEYFLPTLLKPTKSIISDEALLLLLSDITIQKVLPRKVYSLWIEKLVTYTFSDIKENISFALKATAKTIRIMMPGANLVIPLFFYLLNADKETDKWNILDLSNAFASAHVIRCPPNNDKILSLMKAKNIPTKEFQKFNIDNTFSDISLIFNAAKKADEKSDVFASALQAAIEDSIHGFDADHLVTFITKNIDNIPDKTLEVLYSLAHVDKYCTNMICRIVGSLLNADREATVRIATELIILCNEVDFTGALPLVLNVIGKEKYHELQARFVHEYQRYPYTNGINFCESHLNMFDGSATPLIFSDSNTTIVAGHKGIDTKLTLMVKTFNGCSSFRSYATKNDSTPRELAGSPAMVPKPYTEMEVTWGKLASYEPIPLPQITSKTHPSPKRVVDGQDRSMSPNLTKPKHSYPVSDGLTQLGIISPLGSRYRAIQNNSNATREAKAFFSIPTRSTHKIGVIYVGNGQRTQEDLLENQENNVPKEFFNLVGKLGWTVDLTTHQSFTGGLDVTGFTTGKKSIYWADTRDEIMWHIAPMIETQNIYKKRHIGNDMVHVLYSNDTVEYNTLTITSQFNHAHIIVYPLGNRRYCVQVAQKACVDWFGIFRGASVVSEEALPCLVRFTALSADTTARFSATGVMATPREQIEKSRERLWEMRNDENPFILSLMYD